MGPERSVGGSTRRIDPTWTFASAKSKSATAPCVAPAVGAGGLKDRPGPLARPALRLQRPAGLWGNAAPLAPFLGSARRWRACDLGDGASVYRSAGCHGGRGISSTFDSTRLPPIEA